VIRDAHLAMKVSTKFEVDTIIRCLVMVALCNRADHNNFMLFMVALWNRAVWADHYIFALWFLLSFFFLSFFPRLISAVGE